MKCDIGKCTNTHFSLYFPTLRNTSYTYNSMKHFLFYFKCDIAGDIFHSLNTYMAFFISTRSKKVHLFIRILCACASVWVLWRLVLTTKNHTSPCTLSDSFLLPLLTSGRAPFVKRSCFSGPTACGSGVFSCSPPQLVFRCSPHRNLEYTVFFLLLSGQIKKNGEPRRCTPQETPVW